MVTHPRFAEDRGKTHHPGRFGRAITFYRKVWSQHSRVIRNGSYPRPPGDLHLGLGQIQPAIAHLLQARTLQPDEMEYALMLGEHFADNAHSPLNITFFDALDRSTIVDTCLKIALQWRIAAGAEARAYAQIALRFAPLREEFVGAHPSCGRMT